MKVAVIGSGSIGLLVTYYLAKKGIAPLLVTRRVEQAKAVNELGLTLKSKGKNATTIKVAARAISTLTKSETFDLIILAVKSYQLPEVMETLKHIDVKSMLFLQNGMAHTEILPHLAIGETAVAVVEHGAIRENETTVNHTGVGQIRWSYFKQGEKNIQSFLTKCSSDQFYFAKKSDWYDLLVSKLIVNACINPLTAIFNIKNGQLINNEYYYEMLKIVFRDVTYVLGQDNTHWELVCRVCEETAENRSSMLVDLEKNRPTEIESILGYLLKKNKGQEKQVTSLPLLYNGIKGLEEQKGEDND